MKYRVLIILCCLYHIKAMITNDCSGLKMQQLSTPHLSSYIRCTDAGGSNPQWKVNNKTHFSELAQLRLVGPGFSVISLHWHLLDLRSLTLTCFTDSCTRLARALRPRQTTNTVRTTTTTTTTTSTEATTTAGR